MQKTNLGEAKTTFLDFKRGNESKIQNLFIYFLFFILV